MAAISRSTLIVSVLLVVPPVPTIKQLHPLAHAQFASLNFVQRPSTKKGASDKNSLPGIAIPEALRTKSWFLGFHGMLTWSIIQFLLQIFELNTLFILFDFSIIWLHVFGLGIYS